MLAIIYITSYAAKMFYYKVYRLFYNYLSVHLIITNNFLNKIVKVIQIKFFCSVLFIIIFK
jgi:intergrase/recombinase